MEGQKFGPGTCQVSLGPLSQGILVLELNPHQIAVILGPGAPPVIVTKGTHKQKNKIKVATFSTYTQNLVILGVCTTALS